MPNASRIGAVVVAALLSTSVAAPAWAAPGDRPDRPTWAANARALHVGEAQLKASFKGGNAANRSARERAAVADYLDAQPKTAVQIGRSDIKVATVRMRGGLVSTLVAPVEARTRGLDMVVDTETGEISAGLDWTLPEALPMTTGPGMGWQDWSSQTIFRIELKLYVDNDDWNDYLGNATFSTTTRRYIENPENNAWDRWQVRRTVYADPQEWDAGLGSEPMRVKKLWMSNDPVNGSRVRGWLEQQTHPYTDAVVCESNGEITIAGTFTFYVDNCANFDVWRGSYSNDDAGHYRIAYDQGSRVDGGDRKLGYTAGYEMDNEISGANEWYEFVTLSIGSTDDMILKCKDDSKGQGDTDVQSCWWDNEDVHWGLNEDWAN